MGRIPAAYFTSINFVPTCAVLFEFNDGLVCFAALEPLFYADCLLS
jgi:hypothetical protein